jgi:hypothetical protein
MKKLFYFLMILATVSFAIVSCEKDEEDQVKKATLGAQDNTMAGGFYSVSENKVYTMDQGFQKQAAIDILCFYELASGNNIALASPGSGITGIFTGASSVENWTTTNTTRFTKTDLTVAEFDALAETDMLIQNSYDTANNFRKAKDLQIDDIYAFKTQAEAYGLFKVTDVVQGADGSVTFEVKVKK